MGRHEIGGRSFDPQSAARPQAAQNESAILVRVSDDGVASCSAELSRELLQRIRFGD